MRDMDRQRVRVRYDPFNIGHVYAYVGKQWLECVSDYHHLFAGRSERQLRLLTATLRQLDKRHPGVRSVSEKRLADLLLMAEPDEEFQTCQRRDAENARVRARMVSPVSSDDAHAQPSEEQGRERSRRRARLVRNQAQESARKAEEAAAELYDITDAQGKTRRSGAMLPTSNTNQAQRQDHSQHTDVCEHFDIFG